MKLHLGCGSRHLEGFINVDINSEAADIHFDIRSLPFKDGSVDEIYACHVLEHFGRNEFKAVLNEWVRVLH